jgi:hypothetical protein
MSKQTTNFTEIHGKIKYLLENPILATKSLNGLDNYFSNCHGTTAYVLGAEKTFREMAQKPQYFLYAEGRPAYADRDLMKAFLDEHTRPVEENHEFGDIVSFWSKIRRGEGLSATELLESKPVKTIEHTAILIDPKNELVFHQEETGREFNISTIDKYVAKWFPSFRKRDVNLFVDFYRMK